MSINLIDNIFKQTVEFLIKKLNPEEIIETGTYNGLGSTSIFAQTGLPVKTVESCKTHYNLAIDNLQKYPNVSCFWGSSLNIDEMISFIRQDDIYRSDLVLQKVIQYDGDSDPSKSSLFYEREVLGFGETPIDQDLLMKFIDNDKKQIVFLDSAGGVGYLEFQKVLTLDKHKLLNKILLLDDVLHVKHYRSVVHLKQLKQEVVISENKRFAYCILTDNILN
jgi:hypothetical protein